MDRVAVTTLSRSGMSRWVALPAMRSQTSTLLTSTARGSTAQRDSRQEKCFIMGTVYPEALLGARPTDVFVDVPSTPTPTPYSFGVGVARVSAPTSERSVW